MRKYHPIRTSENKSLRESRGLKTTLKGGVLVISLATTSLLYFALHIPENDTPATAGLPEPAQLKRAKKVSPRSPSKDTQTTTMSDHPLVVGRILQSVDEADTNSNGVLSESEVIEFRARQKQERIQLTVDSWFNDETIVVCSRVFVDHKDVYEDVVSLKTKQLRQAYLQDREAGDEHSVREWVNNYFVAQSRDGQLCYKLYARLEDDLREFALRSPNGIVDWSIDVLTSSNGDRTYFNPSQELTTELLKTGMVSDEVKRLAKEWNVGLTAHIEGRWYRVSEGPDEFRPTDELHPAIYNLLQSTGGENHPGRRDASQWAWSSSDKIYHLYGLDQQVSLWLAGRGKDHH